MERFKSKSLDSRYSDDQIKDECIRRFVSFIDIATECATKFENGDDIIGYEIADRGLEIVYKS